MKTKPDILNELNELSPLLFEMKQKGNNPFKIPNDYFEHLKVDLFSAIELGFSENIGKQAFKVPENYFDNLSNNIIAAIENEETDSRALPKSGRMIELTPNRNRTKIRPLRMYAMIAAIVVIALFMTFIRDYMKPSVPQTTSFSQDAMDYIEENYSDFESEDLLALVDLTNESIDLIDQDTYQEDIQQYLEDDIDDFDESVLTNDI